eukprot:GHVT01017049.1.p2 GENE.GHVT01017049.1~~GHVT01017049.1.p2  ORF type:complete len:107 (+),score=27.73 GHVT01017049.1:206-526(+)
MGRRVKARQNAKNRSVKRGTRDLKRRVKDADQILEEIRQGPPAQPPPLDDDLPGLGQHHCVSCSRYFIDSQAMQVHNASKKHKRRAKLVQISYTQEDAEAAAEMTR